MKNKNYKFFNTAIIFAIVTTLALTLLLGMRWKDNNPAWMQVNPIALSIGDKVDSFNGVYVYYNGNIGHVLERNIGKDGYNIGLKYQCVEFVKRYYYLHYKHKMPDSYGHAKDFFNKKLSDSALNQARNLRQFSSPSSSKPKVGDIVIFDGHLGNPYGHVAIVSAVLDESIEIIQQNPGPTAPSRETLFLLNKDGKYELESSLGWLGKR